ncbi:hypothetical protein FPY71_03935 [Aureimonas fodinaquatilis]|uniref:Haemin-degrading HemS/ChuX domain-containing protein n=1 Tax=Aureimonas fodinaquatilis TaxID=2565783 RepID=A0A5B0E1T7_9HYPH|nr:hypothetical protein [Aureimonas fodinaquatilis]KAA0972262.1 hypothetical protein FPY71_03935 [Aureimonas fodinaquatilis]
MTSQVHRIVGENPVDILRRLSGLDRLMLINSTGGITHERIGALSQVFLEGDDIVCLGPDHDCRIHAPSIARMTLDRSRNFGDKSYPRVDFVGHDGETLVSAVSFVGLEPFDAALEGIALEETDNGPDKPVAPRGEDVEADDPGLVQLQKLVDAAAPVTVRIAHPAFSQGWSGVIEKLTPTKGFINIMLPNFHFHLRVKTVAGWKDESTPGGAALRAVDAAGQPLPLLLIAENAKVFSLSA